MMSESGASVTAAKHSARPPCRSLPDRAPCRVPTCTPGAGAAGRRRRMRTRLAATHPLQFEESAVATHPRAGQPAEPGDLVDLSHLVTAYYTQHPDPCDPAQQ